MIWAFSPVKIASPGEYQSRGNCWTSLPDPAGWNAGIFALVKTPSEKVVIPVAGMIMIMMIILCYELL